MSETRPFRRIDGKGDAPRKYKLAAPLVTKPIELLSVTSILSALPKPALKAWGEGLVADAAIEMMASEIATKMDADEMRVWLKEAPYRSMSRAGKRGTGIHEIAEMVLTGRGDPGNSPWGQFVLDWQEQWVGELIAVEQCIVNLGHGWGGTADLIYANKQGKVVLGDWKSSKSVYPDQALQLGAYTRGDRWIVDTDTMTPSFIDPIKIEAVEILHITEKGITTYEPDASLDRLYLDFRAVQRTWQALRGETKIRMSRRLGPPHPTIAEYVVHLRARCMHAQGEQASFHVMLRHRWPSTLPTLKSGLMSRLEQCELADHVVTSCERDLAVSFGNVPPLLAKAVS